MTPPLRIVFMGTAALACPVLDALRTWAGGRLVGVATQPDRPRGRHRHLAACPVRQHLADAGIPIWAPEKINAPDALTPLRQAAPDLIVVMAYGQFLGRDLLAMPPLGCINVHLSLLPQYRGAAPIQWAIANGETETGITIMEMNARMDAGDILAQQSLPILPSDTAASLADRLANAAPPLLIDVLARRARGQCHGQPQDETAATLAPMIKKSDGRIDWRRPATVIERRLRAFTPWPGAYCQTPAPSAHTLRILRAAVEPERETGNRTTDESPGTVLDIDGNGPLIATGREALRLLEVQPEGRRPMTGAAYIRGHRLQPGNGLP